MVPREAFLPMKTADLRGGGLWNDCVSSHILCIDSFQPTTLYMEGHWAFDKINTGGVFQYESNRRPYDLLHLLLNYWRKPAEFKASSARKALATNVEQKSSVF